MTEDCLELVETYEELIQDMKLLKENLMTVKGKLNKEIQLMTIEEFTTFAQESGYLDMKEYNEVME